MLITDRLDIGADLEVRLLDVSAKMSMGFPTASSNSGNYYADRSPLAPHNFLAVDIVALAVSSPVKHC